MHQPTQAWNRRTVHNRPRPVLARLRVRPGCPVGGGELIVGKITEQHLERCAAV